MRTINKIRLFSHEEYVLKIPTSARLSETISEKPVERPEIPPGVIILSYARVRAHAFYKVRLSTSCFCPRGSVFSHFALCVIVYVILTHI